MPVTIDLLADHPELFVAVGEMRWREWGHPPAPVEREFWLKTTTAEAGRDDLPVTFVAIDETGDAVGAVGLDVYDIEERQEVSPWVCGTIVRPDLRGRSIGQALMSRLESWGASHGFPEAWVATEQAQSFYRRCGWRHIEEFVTQHGDVAVVLHKQFGA